MKPYVLALQTQSPSQRVLVTSAVLVAAATLLGLKSPADAHAGTRGGEATAYPATHTATAVPLPKTSASVDPTLVPLIALHRRMTYVPGTLARLPQDRACCVSAGEQ